MIEFAGELSEQSKKALNKIMTSIQFKAACIVSIIAAAAITYFVVTYNEIIALGYLPVIVLLIGSACPQSKKNEHLFCPTRILIDSSRNELFVILNNNKITRHFDDIVCVNDFGEHYKIEFKFPHKSIYFLCQKDLIVQGTLEEFEELFKDKIVHKS